MEQQPKIMKPAKQVVHWPGAEVPACEDHLERLVGLGAILGFQVSWTPCEETTCPNCVSEGRSAEGGKRNVNVNG